MRVVQTNPRRFARIAGLFYLLTFVFGITALRTSGDTSVAANLLGAAVYYVVTVMLYHLYRPVSRTGSLMTALFSFGALTIGVFGDFGVVQFPINTLVLFGAYCIGLGCLTLKGYLPARGDWCAPDHRGAGLAHVRPPAARETARCLGHGAGDDRRRGAHALAVGRRRRSRTVAGPIDSGLNRQSVRD